MVQNNLTEADVYKKGRSLTYPQSVIDFFSGKLGQPAGGFPEELQQIILGETEAITERPGDLLEPVDFSKVEAELAEKLNRQVTEEEVLSYIMYPQVFLDYEDLYERFADVTKMDSLTFFYGMRRGEQIEVKIEKGKTLIISLNSISEPRSEWDGDLIL